MEHSNPVTNQPLHASIEAASKGWVRGAVLLAGQWSVWEQFWWHSEVLAGPFGDRHGHALYWTADWQGDECVCDAGLSWCATTDV